MIGSDTATSASGRPQIVITKDTTFKIGIGGLLALVAYVGFGTYQFLEIGKAESKRVDALFASASSNIASLTTNTNQQLARHESDINWTSRAFEGQKRNFERIEESTQELKIQKERMDQIGQIIISHDRRTQNIETELKEVHRKTAEHAIVIDYLMRWLNPPGTGNPLETPKKRNELYPFKDKQFDYAMNCQVK